MRLAVFDIDGTLTLGEGIGTRCFFRAFAEVFDAPGVEPDLAGYLHSTDCGIAREAAGRHLGRPPADVELARFKQAYLEALEATIATTSGAYRPVPGAREFLGRIGSREGWTVAIATGNWRRAAAMKLECAGLERPAVAACSEDGHSRAAVLGAAIRLAAASSGVERFDAAVYVGDQPWDLRAAREAGAGFVGVGSRDAAARLRSEGARVVEDYLDHARFLAELEEAARVVVPATTTDGTRTPGWAGPARGASPRAAAGSPLRTATEP